MKFDQLNTEIFKNFIIILDIDGTITADASEKVSRGITEVISGLKKNNELYLCTNSKNSARNGKIGSFLGLKTIEGFRKPNKKILYLIENSQNKPYLVIGDKFLTDGIFAKRINARFIKVERIISGKESFLNKLIYWADDLISKFL